MPDLRPSDADRDDCVRSLQRHTADGRPDADELELVEQPDGTRITASGIAPPDVRRAFARLED